VIRNVFAMGIAFPDRIAGPKSRNAGHRVI
jgi:hypothetical protein